MAQFLSRPAELSDKCEPQQSVGKHDRDNEVIQNHRTITNVFLDRWLSFLAPYAIPMPLAVVTVTSSVSRYRERDGEHDALHVKLKRRLNTCCPGNEHTEQQLEARAEKENA